MEVEPGKETAGRVVAPLEVVAAPVVPLLAGHKARSY